MRINFPPLRRVRISISTALKTLKGPRAAPRRAFPLSRRDSCGLTVGGGDMATTPGAYSGEDTVWRPLPDIRYSGNVD